MSNKYNNLNIQSPWQKYSTNQNTQKNQQPQQSYNQKQSRRWSPVSPQQYSNNNIQQVQPINQSYSPAPSAPTNYPTQQGQVQPLRNNYAIPHNPYQGGNDLLPHYFGPPKYQDEHGNYTPDPTVGQVVVQSIVQSLQFGAGQFFSHLGSYWAQGYFPYKYRR